MKFLDWLLARLPVRLVWSYALGIWCIWRAAIRSCYGRIRIQSPTELLDSGAGSAFRRDPTGCLRPNTRTLARSCYIEMLSATYGWVDIVDLRIFLMGFDAGEQWTRHTMGSEPKNKPEISSWLNLAENKLGSVASRVAEITKSESDNLMPPQAVQQSSKHDPSDQPPSRA